MFCTWGSPAGGAGRDREGSRWRLLGGGLGEETRWTATTMSTGGEWGAGSMAETLGELLNGGHRGASADAPGAHPREARRVTLGGVGVRPNGQAIWGASKSFWISGQSLGFPIRTIWLFGFLQCSEWPVPRAPAEAPLCRGQAGTTAPGVTPALCQGPKASGL